MKRKSSISFKGLAAAILLFTLNRLDSISQISNQPVNSHIVAKITCYEVEPEFEEVFRKAMREYVLYSLNDKHNILSEAYYEQDKPSVLWMIERWDNKAALDNISNSAQYKAIDSLSKIGMVRPPKSMNVKDLEPLTKKQWRTQANKNDKPITIMLFVDSKAGTENTFKDVYHTAMPHFRGEPGVINYQLSQFEDDSLQFVTYEKFRSEEAFQYHLNFPYIKPVIDYLNTSIKVQPFQIGLHKLIAFAPLPHE